MAELSGPTLAEELQEVFVRNVMAMPDGERIKACQQCGTCTGSCPTSHLMDYGPREVIAAFRAEQIEQVVKSNTIWMCTSCYSCQVRCPAKIKITDLMYELKRLAIKYDLVPKDAKSPALTKYFVESVHRYGRNHESELMARYSMSKDRTLPFKFGKLGMRLYRNGRLPLVPATIRGRRDIDTISNHLRDEEAKGE